MTMTGPNTDEAIQMTDTRVLTGSCPGWERDGYKQSAMEAMRAALKAAPQGTKSVREIALQAIQEMRH